MQAAPLRSRVRANKWDVQAWEGLGEVLLAFADRPDTLGEQRDMYEELLAQFPTAVSALLLLLLGPTTYRAGGCVWQQPLLALRWATMQA